MANIIVTSLVDTTAADSETTLREAIEQANANPDFDTITFATSGTIVLTQGQLTLSTDLSIDGDLDDDGTADVTIDASGASRVLLVNGGTADLTGLTVTRGLTMGSYGGAGIYVGAAGTLNFADGAISGNSTAGEYADGGGIFNAGTTTLTDTTISGNSTAGRFAHGGGIFNRFGTVTLTNSTISGNSTAGELADGGGIYNRGTATTTLTNSTISGNSTSGNSARGGGIYNDGTTTLTNSTISGNSTAGKYADGGGISNFGTATLTNSTISGNSTEGSNAIGGGVRNDSGVTLTNSIVLGNAAGASGPDVSGSITDNGGNITSGTPADVFAAIDANGGGELADNGGPVQTIALKADATNPALDVGTSTLAEDATGASRDVELGGIDNGGTVDAGAVELQAQILTPEAPSLIVTTTNDVVDAFDGETSLREAIALANSDPDQSDITFADGAGEAFENGGTITLTQGQLTLSTDLSIDGDLDDDGTADVTIDASGASRVLLVNGGTADLTGLTVTRGLTTGSYGGAGIYVGAAGTLNFADGAISGNSTAGDYAEGGGIFNAGTTTLTDTTISGNSTAGRFADGGGIYNRFGTVTLTNSTISGNSTAGELADGGGIFNRGTATLTNSTISGNSTAGTFAYGGGFFNLGTVTLTNSTISGNSTAGELADGGGISNFGTATLTNSIVLGNAAGASGPDVSGSITDNGGNITSGTPADVFAAIDANGGGQLADNGGPVQTIALKADASNPALDIGSSTLLTDATGASRAVDLAGVANGGTVDAGATEVQGEILLSLNSLDSGEYGNKFNGATDADGVITAGFAFTGTDLVLDFKGYDIDNGAELELFLNGVSQGFVGAGVNNGLADYSLTIATADQVAGENIITFEQAVNPAYKWGITDLLLSEATTSTSDISLTLDTLEAGEFGNKFNGQSDADGIITAAFAATGTDLVLDFKGYDIDNGGELELFLNGTSLGFVGAGINNGLADYSIAIAAADQVAGENIITFEQAINPAFKWGITDLLLSEATTSSSDITLTLGTLETGEYGNKFNGQSDADGIITAAFAATGADLVLDFKGYDIDNGAEMELFLNGVSQGFVGAGVNNGLEDYTLTIAAADQVAGENIITFEQAINPAYKWGITDLLLSEVVTADISLTIGTLEAGEYGNKFNGQSDADGVITAGFAFTGTDLELEFKGYDIDNGSELELFLNGVSQGFVDAGVDNGLEDYTLTIAAADQVAGENIITFEQAINPAYKWGITDLLLFDAI